MPSTFLLDGHELKMRDAVVVGDDPGRGDDAVVLLAVGHNHRDVPDGVSRGACPTPPWALVVRDGAKDAHHLPVARLVLTEPISPAVTRHACRGWHRGLGGEVEAATDDLFPGNRVGGETRTSGHPGAQSSSGELTRRSTS